MSLINQLKDLKKLIFPIRYQPLIEVVLHRENLLRNLQTYQQCFSGLKFAPVLKSNAYGHGLVPVAQILDQEKIAFLVVDSLFEATALRHAGIKSEILVHLPQHLKRRVVKKSL